MITVNHFTVVYPAPEDDETDYCPDGECVDETTSVYSFRDLVRMMHEFSECSSYPAQGGTREWLTMHETDYKTGDNIERTMHYGRHNHPRYAKYWTKAMRLAGFVN